MSIRTMTDVGPVVKSEDIVALEAKLDARLPAAYKSFLGKHNGGVPEPRYFKNEALSVFYGVKIQDKLYDLAANQRRMRRYLPDGVIPIARDVFGNEICLAIKGKNRGKVYFWDHEGGPDEDDPWLAVRHLIYGEGEVPKEPRAKILRIDWPGHTDLWLIADSFTEFLDSFHDFELEDEQAPGKPAKTSGKQTVKPVKKQPAKKPRKTPKS